jgi:catechol 2,3-dioxygenase-like lactoylglutathione lyase family enzyme
LSASRAHDAAREQASQEGSADATDRRRRRAARGVAIEGDVVQRRGAYGTGPSLYIRDPDGHVIELKPR